MNRLLARIPGRNKVAKFLANTSNKTILTKIGWTALIIVLYRILAAIPLPGIDIKSFQDSFGAVAYSDVSYIFSIFTGGSFDSPSLVGMGIAAYINASIIIQLLTTVIPRLEQLSEEGERGREIINRYTRLLTLPLGVFYAVGYVVFLRNVDPSTQIGQQIVSSGIKRLFQDLQAPQIILIVACLTAGTMLLMWLAELLTEVGIGNGISIFISMNIAVSLPTLLRNDFNTLRINDAIANFIQQGDSTLLMGQPLLYLAAVILGGLGIIAAIAFITESTRKVPIQYSRRARDFDNNESHLPLKLNQSGVVPVIFASSFLTMPQIIIPILVNLGNSMADDSPIKSFLLSLNNSFLIQGSSTREYIAVYIFLIFVFSFFYAFIVMKPGQLAENLQKSGGYIPGIRPGKSTQNYITRVMMRLTIVGAIFLAIIAIIPLVIGNAFVTDVGTRLAIFSGIGGTSVIIIVGTAIELQRQAKALRATTDYDRYI